MIYRIGWRLRGSHRERVRVQDSGDQAVGGRTGAETRKWCRMRKQTALRGMNQEAGLLQA